MRIWAGIRGAQGHLFLRLAATHFAEQPAVQHEVRSYELVENLELTLIRHLLHEPRHNGLVVGAVRLRLSQVDTDADPVSVADNVAVVTLASCVVKEIDAAGPKAARLAIAGRTFHFACERHAEPMLWHRMPGGLPPGRDAQQGCSTRCDGRPRLSRRPARHYLCNL